MIKEANLYLSWTFCLISERFSEVISRSRYSDKVSVADSKSFWLALNRNIVETQKLLIYNGSWFDLLKLPQIFRFDCSSSGRMQIRKYT
jgi:hypothetical protein